MEFYLTFSSYLSDVYIRLVLTERTISSISYIVYNTIIIVTTIRNEIEINAPIASVFEYHKLSIIS